MSGVSYLLVALVLSIVLSLGLWLAQRKPKTFMSSIDEFRDEMDALARQPHDAGSTPVESPAGPAGHTVAPRRAGRSVKAGRPQPIMPAPAKGDLARKLKDARRLPLHYDTFDSFDTFDSPGSDGVRDTYGAYGVYESPGAYDVYDEGH